MKNSVENDITGDISNKCGMFDGFVDVMRNIYHKLCQDEKISKDNDMTVEIDNNEPKSK